MCAHILSIRVCIRLSLSINLTPPPLSPSWPIRTLAFSVGGELLAAGSEDSYIDVSLVRTGELVFKIPTTAATNTLCWHPNRTLLAYAGDHVDSRNSRSTGSIFLFAPQQ